MRCSLYLVIRTLGRQFLRTRGAANKTHCFLRHVIGLTLFALKLWMIDLRPSTHCWKKNKKKNPSEQSSAAGTMFLLDSLSPLCNQTTNSPFISSSTQPSIFYMVVLYSLVYSFHSSCDIYKAWKEDWIASKRCHALIDLLSFLLAACLNISLIIWAAQLFLSNLYSTCWYIHLPHLRGQCEEALRCSVTFGPSGLLT